jgi:hypothetical protein
MLQLPSVQLPVPLHILFPLLFSYGLLFLMLTTYTLLMDATLTHARSMLTHIVHSMLIHPQYAYSCAALVYSI